MKKYSITIAYDGTQYYGWQSQKDLPAIASAMQAAFARTFNRDIILKGASRTDAGVHALGQVAMFTSDLAIDASALQHAWNNQLPPDIMIRSLEQVPNEYSVYENIDYKMYYYHFFLERPLPFAARFGWFFHYAVDLEKLQQALKIFQGEHDFRSFRSIEDTRENTIRRIDKIYLEYIKKYNVYRIVVIGPKFLRHMIRRIVGACLEVASRPHLPLHCLEQALDEKNPQQELPNAPANGLMLYKIKYAMQR